MNPAKPVDEELLKELDEAINMVRKFLKTRNFHLEEIIEKTGFDRNKAIDDAKEVINENDETRKRFEIMAHEVFVKFKVLMRKTLHFSIF